MNQLALDVKTVPFMGDTLMAARDKEGTIYAGISFMCSGMGMSKSQKDAQIQNIQKDEVLQQGCLKFQAGVFDPNNTTLALKLDYVPLWLAKISITPAMRAKHPELVEKLVNYQLKAKDVLAAAFVQQQPVLALPQDYPSALRALADAEEQRLALAAKVEADAPKLETYERLAARDGLTSIRDTAKLLGIPQKRFVNFLIGNGYCYRDKHGRIRPYAGKGDGLFVVKEYANDATGAHGVQTLVTFEGRELFARKLAA